MKTIIALFASVLVLGTQAHARDRIRIVGSDAVLHYAQSVAENFAAKRGYATPALENTGTGNGFRLFAGGIGYEHPDIVITPRPISQREYQKCQQNGVYDITEIVIGLNSIILVSSPNSALIDLTTAQLFSALAEKIEQNETIKLNPYDRWNDISPALPNSRIQVIGPPQTSTTYDAFLELIMKNGCMAFKQITAMEQARRILTCCNVRKDNAFTTSAKNEYSLIRMLTKNPDSFGIIAYGGWLRNPGLKAHRINGYMPNIETITSGKYPLSRPIYLYVKTQHVHADNEKHQQQPDADIGLQYLLYEFTQEYTIGPPKYDPNTEEMVEGYLIQTGFIPLDDIGRNRAREMAFGLTPMQR